MDQTCPLRQSLVARSMSIGGASHSRHRRRRGRGGCRILVRYGESGDPSRSTPRGSWRKSWPELEPEPDEQGQGVAQAPGPVLGQA